MNKILVADDDQNICEILKLYLEKESYEVITCTDGLSAVNKFKEHKPQMVLLDIMMPNINGYEVCKIIRSENKTVPIIMISAKDQIPDKIMGLDLGADDYIAKPFDANEVVARIKAIFRRINGDKHILEFTDLIIDLESFYVVFNNEKYELPPKEIELLYFLASNPNKVYTREQLLSNVWGMDYLGDSRTVDVHIKRLRGRFSHKQWEIKTVWGVGYKFEVK